MFSVFSFIGEVTPPKALEAWGGGTCGGPILALTNVVFKLVFIVAGIWALWKFIEAGFSFINSGGDAQKLSAARDKIMFTFVGLLIMASSFALAGLVGLLFFGSFDAILNPSITGAGTCAP